ncbi:MAG: hypothetical protein FWD28_01855 [Treponema sp.]|nr:hypothetical protein [Treponema sp.]
MKKMFLLLFCITLFLSCDRNTKDEKEEIIVLSENTTGNDSTTVSLSLLIGENHDLLTDHYWLLTDARHLVDRSISTIDWMGPMTPRIIFYKLEIPSGSILYQERLRKERFSFMYQTEELNKLRVLENTFFSGIYNFEFNTNLTNFALKGNNIPYGTHERVGQQASFEYPLVGIWGRLPALTEYRLVDLTGCLYYMEIDKEILYFAIREGTYLLKQIDDRTFETVSAFPDGNLRLEVTSDRRMLLTPLFTLPDDEEGILGQLELFRNPFRISDFDEHDGPF